MSFLLPVRRRPKTVIKYGNWEMPKKNTKLTSKMWISKKVSKPHDVAEMVNPFFSEKSEKLLENKENISAIYKKYI
jgi:hypothetical protein